MGAIAIERVCIPYDFAHIYYVQLYNFQIDFNKYVYYSSFLNQSHTQTDWGIAFRKALDSARPGSASHQEQLFTALELIRFGYLNANTFSRSYYGGPSVGSGKILIIESNIFNVELYDLNILYSALFSNR
jgi:hypothetical protein